jgi:hypothetical protein
MFLLLQVFICCVTNGNLFIVLLSLCGMPWYEKFFLWLLLFMTKLLLVLFLLKHYPDCTPPKILLSVKIKEKLKKCQGSLCKSASCSYIRVPKLCVPHTLPDRVTQCWVSNDREEQPLACQTRKSQWKENEFEICHKNRSSWSYYNWIKYSQCICLKNKKIMMAEIYFKLQKNSFSEH